MAISKLILNGVTQMDVTTDTVDAQYMVSGKTATKADGTKATGTIASKSSSDLTASGATVTVPAGYYSSQASKSVATATQATPSVSVNTSTGLITATATQTAGYVSAGSKSGTSQLTVQAGKTVTPTESEQTAVAAQRYTTGAIKVAAIPSDYIGSDIETRSDTDLTVSGATVTAPSGYYSEAASKSVASGSATTPATTVTANPSISVSSSGLITATASATKSVTPTVSAGYVSSGTAGTITVSGSNTSQLSTQAAKTVYPSFQPQTAVEAGKYTTGVVTVDAMPTGTEGIPIAAKQNVDNHSITVIPSVTNAEGYITGSTKIGTGVVVSASELVSGVKNITENGTGIDVTNYASVNVDVHTGPTRTATITRTGMYDVRGDLYSAVRYPNYTTVYYTQGDTFEFTPNTTMNIRVGLYSSGNITITVDGLVVDSTTSLSRSYDYTLPDSDIEIALDSSMNKNDIEITTVGSGSITVNPLSVTTNGTYTAPTGTAYSPVTVNVEGGGSVEPKDVNFIDYDGTILYSYTTAEALALDALPSNPSHSGLTAQGWNYTLAQVKTECNASGKCTVGQMYITSSGNTEIDISLDSGHLSPYLTIAVNGSVTIDWGDNSATDTVTGTSLTTLKYTLHEYAIAGDYVISISVNSGSFTFYNSSTSKLSVLSSYGSESNRRYDREYAETIHAIRLGNGITSIGNSAFANCYGLQTITMPNSITSLGTGLFWNCYSIRSFTIPDMVTDLPANEFYYAYCLQSVSIPNGVTTLNGSIFQYCTALRLVTLPSSITSMAGSIFYNCTVLQSATIPNGVTSLGNNMFYYCSTLQSVTIPNGVTNLGNYAFYYCYMLRSITLPNSITSINTYMFNSCYSLRSITIPDSVTNVGASAFANCYAMEEYHFLSTTPPTLANTNAFGGISTGTKIYVPSASLEAYQTATNWSTYASYMVGE